MPATREQQQKIQLLSDTVLYREALDFIKAQKTVEGLKQMRSLMIYTQTWSDLITFVRHQQDRDWTGRKEYYKQFFTALTNYLTNLQKRVETDWFPPESGLTNKQKKERVDYFSILVAREFVQHLAAENFYREKTNEQRF